MRSLVSLIAGVVIIAAFRAEVAGVERVDDAQLAMDITQEACDAIRLRDVASLERLLAPEFKLVTSSAEVQSRDQVLAEVRSGEPKYDVFRNHSMTARVYGNAAVVQGITSLEGTSGGNPFEIDVRFTDTLVKEDG